MSDTKTAIINLAEELVLSKGYNWFSYADIAKPLNIKNAAIHYHFPNKEDLGVAIVEKQGGDFRQLKSMLAARGANEIESLRSLSTFYSGYIEEKKVCMIGSMGTDVMTLPELVQQKLKGQLDEIWRWLANLLESGRERGLFRFEGEPRIKALDYLTNVSAGVQIIRITGKQNEFDALVDLFFEEIKV
jgi:TetR/AcrR family transcriptional regulator, transcriptional repressor for nem operon